MNNKIVCQLRFDEENERITFDNTALHCGDCFEVLIFNGLTNKAEWIDTSLEMNHEKQWYLSGLIGYDIIGLFARM